MGLSFTNLPKSKHFSITTRFYDAQKEAMKEREERYKKEIQEKTGEEPVSFHGASIKGSFRNAAKINSKTVADVRRKSNRRLLYIIIILSILIYIVLK
jgi:hypothetical protein